MTTDPLSTIAMLVAVTAAALTRSFQSSDCADRLAALERRIASLEAAR